MDLKKISGALTWISCRNKKHLWGVNSQQMIYHYGENKDWAEIPGKLVCVSAGVDGVVYGVNSGNDIYRLQNGNQWTGVPGKLKMISVGSAQHIWGVNAGNDVYRWGGNSWVKMAGKLEYVSVNSHGAVVGNNAAGNIYKWNGNSWVGVAGVLKKVEIAEDGSLFGVNANGSCYRMISGGGSWEDISAAFGGANCHHICPLKASKFFYIRKGNNEILSVKDKRHKKKSGGMQVKTSGYEVTWSSFYCAGCDKWALDGKEGYACWAAKVNDGNQWVQMTFPKPTKVGGIVLQGRGDAAPQWLTGLNISAQKKNGQWIGLGQFQGCRDQHTHVQIKFPEKVKCIALRMNNFAFHGHMASRFAVLMKVKGGDGGGRKTTLLDFPVKFSGMYNQECNKYKLDSPQYGWVPRTNDDNQWLQIELPQARYVRGIVLQGRPDCEQWVTELQIDTQDPSGQWIQQGRYLGNTDRNTKKEINLRRQGVARVIRLSHFKWQGFTALRVGLLVGK